jgi:L-ascorbate metabolism protein UlaG (beta-lactamase superfamily)
MIKPFLQDDAFLADVASARGDASCPHIWWLGQSGFLVQFRGRHLLIDPYLSDSLTKKYAASDKPHVRMIERVVDPARLDFIDVVTSSHNHTDHLDGDTLVPLIAANPGLSIIVPEANRVFAAGRLGIEAIELIGMDDGTTRHVGPFTFHGVPAAHDQLEQDERGHHRYMGYVIQLQGAPSSPRGNAPSPFTIYHSGDTIPYEGLADRLRRFTIDLALLPINGRGPERKVAGNLWGDEAATLAKEVGAKLAVPCHYDMFTFNTATPEQFVAQCERSGQAYRVPRCGERFQ